MAVESPQGVVELHGHQGERAEDIERAGPRVGERRAKGTDDAGLFDGGFVDLADCVEVIREEAGLQRPRSRQCPDQRKQENPSE